jgi:hypothetical protein
MRGWIKVGANPGNLTVQRRQGHERNVDRAKELDLKVKLIGAN